MKVALIQMAIREGQPKQNTKTVLALLEKAVLDEPDVIVLPEIQRRLSISFQLSSTTKTVNGEAESSYVYGSTVAGKWKR